MSSYSFYCRCSKQNRYGYSPIELSIIINQKRCFINLPRKEKPQVFKRLMAAKQNNQLKEYIALQISAINSAITDIMAVGKPLTAKALKDYLQNGGIKPYTLGDLFKDYLHLIEEKSTLENYQKYSVVINEFSSFIDDKNRPLVNVSNADIQGFYTYLLKSYKVSTSASKMARLKCIFRYAQDNNLIAVNVFSGVKLHRQRPRIEYLTEEEVGILLKKDFGIDRLNRVRDLFLFQCGSGLAYADMASLRPSDVQMDGDTAYINKCRQKTEIQYTAVLLNFALDILKKYNYQLPIMSNQKMNAYLQEVGVLAGIDKKLHSHLGRKTYATSLLNRGVNISVVSKCLGHANTLVTQSTYAAMRTSTVVNSVKAVVEVF